jgi:hypothetical protein
VQRDVGAIALGQAGSLQTKTEQSRCQRKTGDG